MMRLAECSLGQGNRISNATCQTTDFVFHHIVSRSECTRTTTAFYHQRESTFFVPNIVSVVKSPFHNSLSFAIDRTDASNFGFTIISIDGFARLLSTHILFPNVLSIKHLFPNAEFVGLFTFVTFSVR